MHNGIDVISKELQKHNCRIVEYDSNSNLILINRIGEIKHFVKIPSLVTVRKHHIPIKNRYEIIDSRYDFHICCYYKNNKNCQIDIIRLDEDKGWDEGFKIKVYDIEDELFDEYSFEEINVSPNKGNKLSLNITIDKIRLEYELLNYHKKQKIPKHIIQTMEDDEVSVMHWNSIQTILDHNPEYTYIFFTAAQRRAFIKEYFESDVLDTYDGFVPGAFQADLFRYCYLYKKGGCYIDCKMIARAPIRELIEPHFKTVITKDRIHNALQNNIIFSEPGNIIMRNAIDLCVDRFKQKIMEIVSFGSLHHTGPFLLYDAYKKSFNEEYDKIGIYFDAPFDNDFYKNYCMKSCKSDKLYFNMIYNGYYSKYKYIHRNSIWSELWAKKEIYYTNKTVLEDKIIYIYPNNQSVNYNKKYKFYIDENTKDVLFNIDDMYQTDKKHTNELKVKIIDENTNDFVIKTIYKKIDKSSFLL